MPAGTGIFTLLGFAGLYLFVGILYLVLIVRIVNQGPEATERPTTSAADASRSREADGDRSGSASSR